MEPTPISRFNSQSTSSTLVGSYDSIVSPLASPSPYKDGSALQSPIVQTEDNKQWLDLDVVSPKLLKELRRQYDPSIKDEPSGPLAKSASRLKAFVKQSKLGIEIRLRRKINAEHDEVTDIHLIPDAMPQEPYFQDEKLPTLPELAASSNEVLELPDSSAPVELDTTLAPSRTSTGSSVGEPLPRYEPRNDVTSIDFGAYNLQSTTSPKRSNARRHKSSTSQSSILATPRRGLSLRDPEPISSDEDFASEEKSEDDVEEFETVANAIDAEIQDLATSQPSNLKENLADEPRIPESLENFIRTLIKEETKQHTENAEIPEQTPIQSSKPIAAHFKIASRTTYETETDVDTPSPANQRRAKPFRKKNILNPKRKNSTSKAKFVTADDDLQAQSDSLVRKQTIPKRLAPSAGAEAIWVELLQRQATLLGFEHPLVHQAKADLARCRSKGYAYREDIASLKRSELVAIETFEADHPKVTAFSHDLKTLNSLMRPKGGTDFDDKSNSPKLSSPRSGPAQQKQLDQHLSSGQPMDPAQVSPTTSLPKITTTFHDSNQGASPAANTDEKPPPFDDFWNSHRPPHKPRKDIFVLPTLAFDALLRITMNGITWSQRSYGPEQPVAPGKVRVRWTCSCGEQMYDDFIEKRPGAARELEAYLNRPRTHGTGGTPISPDSSNESRSFTNSSIGGPPSSQTSPTSYGGSSGHNSFRNGRDTKPPQTYAGMPLNQQYTPFYEPPWLLTCANEDKFTPKLEHLNMDKDKIRSDRDLAMRLREHYFKVNRKWWRALRLRGLTTIEFVQLEVHTNRFADIRKCPDMPPLPTEDYDFVPGDLLPPVGSQYLLHLFKHPEDYDGELITYLRAPKRNGRLHIGVGWGINLVEGFLADKVWMLISAFFALGSVVFAVAYGTRTHDIQGASGVAAWIVSLSVLVVGWLQAFLG